jgi:hypothetical protein
MHHHSNAALGLSVGLMLLAGCGGGGGTDVGAGSDPQVELSNLSVVYVAPAEVELRWRTTAPTASTIEWKEPGQATRSVHLPRDEQLDKFWRSGPLPPQASCTARVVLKPSSGVNISSRSLTISRRSGEPEPAGESVIVKSGVSVLPQGTHGVDFVVEPLYHDRNSDDRCIVYMSSGAALRLERNANDNDPIGDPASGVGQIRYQLNRDEQAGAYVGSGARGSAYTGDLDLSRMEHEPGVPLLGTYGSNGKAYGARPQYTTERYWRAIQGPDGDEWHVLTVWQDDSGWFTGGSNGKPRASDGVVIPLVVDPEAPTMRFVADAGQQFYTTPPKTYHVPVVHVATTYCSSDVRLYSHCLGSSDPIEYRVEGGAWESFTNGLKVSALLHGNGYEQLLELRNTRTGGIRSRKICVDPDYPSKLENHPRTLLWSDAAEKASTLDRMHNGPSVVRDAYRAIRDYGYYNGLSTSYGVGTRRGWRSYEKQARYALRNAFVCEVEGYGYDNEAYAQHAKSILLNLGGIEPIGMENPLWWPGPALERVSLGFEQAGFRDAAVAYSLLIGSYRQDQSFAQGLTAIEDIKIRDAIAMQVKTALQFRDNSQTSTGEGDVHWALGLDLASLVETYAMPRYSSDYYGSAGVDTSGMPAIHAPWPMQQLSWVDAIVDEQLSTPGHPGIVHKSRIFVVYQNSKWLGPKAYEKLFYELTPSTLNVLRRQGESTLFPNLVSYLQAKVAGGLAVPSCVNGYFSFAGTAAAHCSSLTSSQLRSVWSLSFYAPDSLQQ